MARNIQHMTTLKDLLADFATEIIANVEEKNEEPKWLEDLTDDYIEEIIERIIK